MACIRLTQEISKPPVKEGSVEDQDLYSLGPKKVEVTLDPSDLIGIDKDILKKRYADAKYRSAKIVVTADGGLNVILEIE
jgi:hypothetical protein